MSKSFVFPQFLQNGELFGELVGKIPCGRLAAGTEHDHSVCPFAHSRDIPCSHFHMLKECVHIDSACAYSHSPVSPFSIEYACMVAARIGDQNYRLPVVEWLTKVLELRLQEHPFIEVFVQHCAEIPCGAAMSGLTCMFLSDDARFCPFAHGFGIPCQTHLFGKCYDEKCCFSHPVSEGGSMPFSLAYACLVSRVAATLRPDFEDELASMTEIAVDRLHKKCQQRSPPAFLFLDAHNFKGDPVFVPKNLVSLCSSQIIRECHVYVPASAEPQTEQASAGASASKEPMVPADVFEYFRFLKPFVDYSRLHVRAVPRLTSDLPNVLMSSLMLAADVGVLAEQHRAMDDGLHVDETQSRSPKRVAPRIIIASLDRSLEGLPQMFPHLEFVYAT
eukprot:ANDGO_02231.mRNA.1 hypothetical protein